MWGGAVTKRLPCVKGAAPKGLRDWLLQDCLIANGVCKQRQSLRLALRRSTSLYTREALLLFLPAMRRCSRRAITDRPYRCINKWLGGNCCAPPHPASRPPCPGRNHRLLPALAKNMPLAYFLNAPRPQGEGFCVAMRHGFPLRGSCPEGTDEVESRTHRPPHTKTP